MRLPSMCRLFVLLTTVGTLGGLCADAQAEEPRRVIRVDPDAYPPPSTRMPLLLTGTAVTGAFYGAAVGASYLWPEARGAADLRIPVVGPWMKLFQTGCSETQPSCNRLMLVIGAVLVGLDGLGQAGGVGLLLEGIFLQTRHPPPAGQTAWAPGGAFGPQRALADRLATGSAADSPSSSFVWYPVPWTAGDDGVGLGLAGAF